MTEDGQSRRAENESYASDIRPVLQELASIGYAVPDVLALPEVARDYQEAIPILLRWLRRSESRVVKEAIARALTNVSARPVAAPTLIEEFKKSDDLLLRWAIGNALAVVADDSVYDDVVALVTDKRYGRAREMLVLALANMKNPSATDVLTALLEDEEVAGHAIGPLGEMKARAAANKIQPYLNHPKAWIRREARSALKRMGLLADA